MNNGTGPADLAAEIEQIRAQYVERLKADGKKLKSILAHLKENPEQELLGQVHPVLHSISGSAGTFGFSEISSEARYVDVRLSKAISRSNGAQAEFAVTEMIPELENFCELLERSAEQPALKTTSFAADPESQPETSSNEPTAPPKPAVGEVWLIEEDEVLAEQFAEQISKFNFKIRTIDLKKALQLAQNQGWPQATIIDLDDKLLDGVSSLSSVLTVNGASPDGLIMLSEDDSFESRIRAAKARAVSFLKKPISMPVLVSQLEEQLDNVNTEPQRVLLIDDDKELCSYLQANLKSEGMVVKVLKEIKDIVSVLDEFRPELLLLDMEMPNYTGIDIALLVRQYAQFKSLPIVYLSAEHDLTKQSEALLFDADDFLTKPISHQRLTSSIRSRVQRARVLEQLISKDSLTGLLKHGAIKDQAERERQRNHREDSPMSIVMLDIDHFKLVNDTYGHATGDIVIASLATLLRHRLRRTDIIGRYGGEEFMVILPSTSQAQAIDIINGVRESFSNMEFTAQKDTFSCSFSAGCVSTVDLPTVTDASDLIEAADEALYVSKKQGRNRVSGKQTA